MREVLRTDVVCDSEHRWKEEKSRFCFVFLIWVCRTTGGPSQHVRLSKSLLSFGFKQDSM
ncbi:unnamed protein product [Rhodiola kirilowii]